MTGDAVWSAASFSCRANINAELSDQIHLRSRTPVTPGPDV